mmetsp:Transcript_6027/g.15364  ORF Transcript_6027/g.15364 Transcript_6027/m.15364 type:complete len:200 (-) Transcript_6027:712-1311(-)
MCTLLLVAKVCLVYFSSSSLVTPRNDLDGRHVQALLVHTTAVDVRLVIIHFVPTRHLGAAIVAHQDENSTIPTARFVVLSGSRATVVIVVGLVANQAGSHHLAIVQGIMPSRVKDKVLSLKITIVVVVVVPLVVIVRGCHRCRCFQVPLNATVELVHARRSRLVVLLLTLVLEQGLQKDGSRFASDSTRTVHVNFVRFH